MNTELTETITESPKKTNRVKEEAPEIARAFGAMFQSLMKPGTLTVREKELIALGIGLAVRCIPCISAHTEKAMKAGATRAQILETAGVVVMMQGGPGYTYVPHVIEAMDAVEQQASSREP